MIPHEHCHATWWDVVILIALLPLIGILCLIICKYILSPTIDLFEWAEDRLKKKAR